MKRKRAQRLDMASNDDGYRTFVGLITLTCLSTLAVAVSLSLSLV